MQEIQCYEKCVSAEKCRLVRFYPKRISFGYVENLPEYGEIGKLNIATVLSLIILYEPYNGFLSLQT